MIALLPVRGWMGDAMALAMLAPPAHAGGQAQHTSAPPCPDHAASVPGDAGDNPGSHTHAHCDICNGPAIAGRVADAQAKPHPQGIRVSGSERFASLDPPQVIKPPIS